MVAADTRELVLLARCSWCGESVWSAYPLADLAAALRDASKGAGGALGGALVSAIVANLDGLLEQLLEGGDASLFDVSVDEAVLCCPGCWREFEELARSYVEGSDPSVDEAVLRIGYLNLEEE